MSLPLTFRRPEITSAEAATVARERFGLAAGPVSELPSERDRNFLLQPPGRGRVVLKFSHADDPESLLDLQHRALERVRTRVPGLAVPAPLPSVAGREIEAVEGAAGERHLVRALSWVEGQVLARVRYHPPELLESLGEALGRLDGALQGFSHGAAARDLKWDLTRADWVREQLERISGPGQRDLAARQLARFDDQAAPALGGLRRGVIHNDANDWNVIVAGGGPCDRRVAGFVDFGDMLESVVVADLAIACAYASLGKRDPLSAMASVVAGYDRVFPLEEAELAALFPLACARLLCSVVNAACQRAAIPDNAYLTISEAPAWDALACLDRLHPRLAHYTLRAAAGREPCPRAPAVRQWLAAHPERIGPLLDLPADTVAAPLDLSIGSPLVETPEEPDDLPRFTREVFGRLDAAGARVGLGSYDEARVLYTSAGYAAEGNDRPMPRTVHIGLDLFATTGTGVLVPMDGTVESVRDNGMDRDYGPTLILRHEPAEGPVFHTLYGHLGREVLDRVTPGARVTRGQRIATIGDLGVNGGWTPHLHFQVICDLLDREGEFPGVARPDQRPVWHSLSPDPNLMARYPAELLEPAHRRGAAIAVARRERIGPSLSLSYRRPLTIVRGWKQWLYDEDALAYLDAVNNVPHVGHSHPAVVGAVREQMALLNTNTRYLHERLVEYAERLTATLPAPLRVCYFVNSGSEANELALRLARTATGRRGVVVIESGYHGNTTTLVELSHFKHAGPGGGGAPSWVRTIPMPDGYRGAWRTGTPDAGARYAAAVGEAIGGLREAGEAPAAFLAESVLSCGGQIVLPDGFLPRAYEEMRAAGGVCIADEVQVGLGRTGTHMWAFETQGVIPDIVTMGKPIGNGHPLGAVVTTAEIAAAFANGMEYFSTFGGNPVSCAAGLAVLDVLEAEGLRENARIVGERLLAGLRSLVDRHGIAGDARGLGLFAGLELVRDPETREPAGREAEFVANRLRDCGVLASTDGPFRNVLKFKPPLCFTAADADRLLQTLDRILPEAQWD